MRRIGMNSPTLALELAVRLANDHAPVLLLRTRGNEPMPLLPAPEESHLARMRLAVCDIAVDGLFRTLAVAENAQVTHTIALFEDEECPYPSMPGSLTLHLNTRNTLEGDLVALVLEWLRITAPGPYQAMYIWTTDAIPPDHEQRLARGGQQR